MTRVVIERLGARGDGVVGETFVAFTLPGETVEIAGEKSRARLVELVAPSPDRIEPICPVFTRCGGCALQHQNAEAYAKWKRALVVDALSREGLSPPVDALVDAHGAGRRRVTLHARKGVVGFAEAKSHSLVPLDACPVLAPGLAPAFAVARALEKAYRGTNKPLDIVFTLTRTGLDVDVRGAGRVDGAFRLALVELATAQDLARLSNHGDVVIERRAPIVRFAGQDVPLPPGSFLQATEAADEVLTALVLAALGPVKRVADLFCGSGTFTFPLSATAAVRAVDGDRAAIAALDRAARAARLKWPITSETRDLFRRPLLEVELRPFDAVVFDPPRAGAELQARRLAASSVPRLAAVSCDVTTFARDAAILVAGGYTMTRVTPVDQFRYTPHVEIVAAFERKT